MTWNWVVRRRNDDGFVAAFWSEPPTRATTRAVRLVTAVPDTYLVPGDKR